jgi:signal transduction histidine kinase
MRRRLYLHIYLGFLGITALVLVVSAAVAWHWQPDEVPTQLAEMAALVGEALPGPERPADELESALADRARRLGLHLSVWSAAGERLAYAGEPLPAPPPGASGTTWLPHEHMIGTGVAVRLADGRWLGVAFDGRPWRRGAPPFVWLAAFGLITAAGAYPVARRIARRLERLDRAVNQLGSGDLSARVAVEGKDEVADLARSFNRAAERIQSLVGAQRRMLASASHELRTPLARLRMAVELLGAERPELRAEAERDVAELDALIDDLLLAARLTTLERPATSEPVDLAKLVAEECARTDTACAAEPVVVQGDARLLRRLLANLLENARRHGGDREVQVSVGPRDAGDGAVLRVADRGPGVPESERERIFEAFYRPPGHSESNDGGVGLGLALVREIARQHRGDARCLPRPGGGTLFEVELRGVGSA